MKYNQKIAEKYKDVYKMVDHLYLGNMNTVIETTGGNGLSISTPSANITIDTNGNVQISGNSTNVELISNGNKVIVDDTSIKMETSTNTNLTINESNVYISGGSITISGNSTFNSIITCMNPVEVSSNTVLKLGKACDHFDAESVENGTLWQNRPLSSSNAFFEVEINGVTCYVPAFHANALTGVCTP